MSEAISDEPVGAVIFDYGGVISAPVFHDLDPIDDELGVPRGSMHRLLFEGDDGAEPDFHRLEVGTMGFAEYLEGLKRRAPTVIGRELDAEAFFKFAVARPLQVQWPVVHRIRALQAIGLRLALLTNNVREFAGTWRTTFPVDELFPIVIDSSEVGLRKPDPRIYELTCARVGVELHAAVFLDDNLENVEAARALRIESVLVTPDPIATVTELDRILAARGLSIT